MSRSAAISSTRSRLQRLPYLAQLRGRRRSLYGYSLCARPEQINTAGYLAGGRPFGPIISPNITPDKNGQPAGLTFAQFLNVFRTGVDPDNSTRLLQVMPWPAYKNMTDRDIFDIYVYLTAIPSITSTEAAAQQ